MAQLTCSIVFDFDFDFFDQIRFNKMPGEVVIAEDWVLCFDTIRNSAESSRIGVIGGGGRFFPRRSRCLSKLTHSSPVKGQDKGFTRSYFLWLDPKNRIESNRTLINCVESKSTDQ